MSLRQTILACALTITGLPGVGARALVAVPHPDSATQDGQQNGKWARVTWDNVEIEFEGNQVFTAEQLVKSARQRIETNNDRNKTFNDELLEYCLKFEVVNFMRSKGYLEAKIGEPKLQETEKGLRVTVAVKEGLLYRLGQIKIEGAKHFSESQLREMLDLKAGEVAYVFALSEWLNKRMKKAYGDVGYIQYFAEFEPIFRDPPDGGNEALVDFTVTITEGKAFVLRRVEFKGNMYTPDWMIRNALLVKEDEMFSQSKFEESIKKLNDLDLFDWIDAYGDSEFRTDEEMGDLEITIRLTDKSQEPPQISPTNAPEDRQHSKPRLVRRH